MVHYMVFLMQLSKLCVDGKEGGSSGVINVSFSIVSARFCLRECFCLNVFGNKTHPHSCLLVSSVQCVTMKWSI